MTENKTAELNKISIEELPEVKLRFNLLSEIPQKSETATEEPK